MRPLCSLRTKAITALNNSQIALQSTNLLICRQKNHNFILSYRPTTIGKRSLCDMFLFNTF